MRKVNYSTYLKLSKRCKLYESLLIENKILFTYDKLNNKPNIDNIKLGVK